MKRENDWQTANAQNYIWSYRGDRIILKGRDIVYVHIEQRKVYIHTRTAVYRVGGTLRDTAERLKELPMIRTHAAYLVHMDYLQRINRSMAVLKNGEQIPVSTRCWKDVKPIVETYGRESARMVSKSPKPDQAAMPDKTVMSGKFTFPEKH